MQIKSGKASVDAASTTTLESDLEFAEAVLIGQEPISKTPRSNAAIYTDTWDLVRELLPVRKKQKKKV